MNKDRAIQMLERLQDPDYYQITSEAFGAIQMAIDALENQKSVCEEYCEYEDCEAEKMVVQSLSSLYPLKEFEEIAIDKVLDAVKQPKHIRGRWIPVTERLPEKGIDVLVTRKYDGREDGHKSCCYVEVASCFGQDDGVTWNSYSDEYKMHPRNHSVIAWMPLPEPCKGVTE